MPEGHTIHRIAKDHRRDFVGQRLRVSSPQGRFANGAKKLDRRALEHIEAYGKHLFYHWHGGRIVHIHLGLYGKFRRHQAPPPEPRGAVRLRTVGDKYAFDLNGPNCCELVDDEARLRIVNRLGADPLRKDVDVDTALQRIRTSRAPIGSLLLNQSIIAGVGNVYRAEVLFALRIDPLRPGNALDPVEVDRIWEMLQRFLKIGVKYNKIITTDPQDVGKPPSRMRAEERLMIYKKQCCPECDGHVQAWALAARTIYACKRCQK